MLKIIISVILLSSIECLNLCGDWTTFKDTKCIKVLDKIGTEEEAVGNCTKLDQSSTLMTIHSKEEQDFLNTLLSKYNTTSAYAWIGLKYTLKLFKWIDSSQLNFENWAKDAVKDGTALCVQMYLSGTNLGKWTDENCKKTALIVCQKNVVITLPLLKNFIEIQETKINSMETNFEKQQKQLNSIIPIGFLYTQLPNTSAPNELWPQFKWSDVTRNYSGLFFRAEGGESLPFGQIQPQNQSWISDVHLQGGYPDSWNSETWHSESYSASLNQGQWTETNPGHTKAIAYLQFYRTGGETRPKNSAVRIFERIQ